MEIMNILKKRKKPLNIILLYSYSIRGLSHSDSFSLEILKLMICHHIKNSKSITFSDFFWVGGGGGGFKFQIGFIV